MALSIDWNTFVITVPRADMTIVQASPEIRELDVNAFRLELKDIEDDQGMPYPDTHRHNPPVSLGGVALARVVEIINGYSVTFEDGQYAVNLTGANNNISDVTNVNQVSIRASNSAGLIQAGSGLTPEEQARLLLILELLEADEIFTPSQATKYRKGTTDVLLQKTVSGGSLSGTITIDE